MISRLWAPEGSVFGQIVSFHHGNMGAKSLNPSRIPLSNSAFLLKIGVSRAWLPQINMAAADNYGLRDYSNGTFRECAYTAWESDREEWREGERERGGRPRALKFLPRRDAAK